MSYYPVGKNHQNWKGGLPKCVDCGKQLKVYRAKRCLICVKSYLSNTFRGINHPGWMGGPSKCLDCGKQLSRRDRKRCKSCANTGKLNPQYINGKGRITYSVKFNNKLKLKIRTRDNFRCKCCSLKESNNKRGIKQIKLTVHHIDYNRKNCKENNLIAVCQKCNSKVNFNRDYWFVYFTYIMENK